MALFNRKSKGQREAEQWKFASGIQVVQNNDAAPSPPLKEVISNAPQKGGFSIGGKGALREENEFLKAQIEELSSLMTPELQDLQNIKKKVDSLKLTIDEYNDKINYQDKKIKEQTQQLNLLQSDIIVAEETIELESFSLYRPRWDFSKADEYKVQLQSVINRQKAMIKNGTAAYGNMQWTVNNSKSQGLKLVKDMIKLCLRSFNNECDFAISSVRFNNYDRCENRIHKSAEAVQKLAKLMNVSISGEYVNLKVQQLQLALEYEMKKQEEKEYLRELRAQEREEAKALKEMEAARKVAEKEQSHYSNALSQILQQLESASNDNEIALLSRKKQEIELRLGKIEENIKELDYRYANRKAGYVYIVSNIGAFGKDIYKIGMTRRLEPQERVDELSDASVPFKFDVHAMIFSDDAPTLEAALHKEFESRKVNMVNNRKEFFNVSLDEIKEVIHKNHDKVVEFTDVPPAAQYRESLKMK